MSDLPKQPLSRQEQYDANIAENVRKIRAMLESAGGVAPEGTIDISENGTYDVTGYTEANVHVDSGSDVSDVIVEPLEITENGTYDTTNVSSVEVDVPGDYIWFTFTANSFSEGFRYTGELTATLSFFFDAAANNQNSPVGAIIVGSLSFTMVLEGRTFQNSIPVTVSKGFGANGGTITGGGYSDGTGAIISFSVNQENANTVNVMYMLQGGQLVDLTGYAYQIMSDLKLHLLFGRQKLSQEGES